MGYYLFFLQLMLAIMLLFLFWQSVKYFQNMRLYKRLKTTPFPKNYEEILQQIPHYRVLSPKLKDKIHFSILLFIEKKEFIGIKMDITDEVKVVIAFFASLMTVNMKNRCYEALKTIIVYPYYFVVDALKADGGIELKEKLILGGQSANGTVVIAWNEAKKEAYHLGEHNLIVHEFAHELDFEDGIADGIPPLIYTKYKTWASVMFGEYKKLNSLIKTGEDLEKHQLIGTYAASNEAEFFAVVSELFFEKPKILKEKFPDIYEQLKSFYNIDMEKLL